MNYKQVENDLIPKFLTLCREKKIKVTPQRLEIYQELIQAQNHPSAEEIYQKIKVKHPSISLDTVYRTLSLYECHGIISRVRHLDNRSHYDPNREVHHHFICSKCHHIYDVYWSSFDQLPLPNEVNQWGQVVSKSVEIHGICRTCLPAPSSK